MVEIVRTPGMLGGFPRLAGRRIGVHHILGTLEACGDERATVKRMGISTEAVRAAVVYAEAHPDVMADVRREREGLSSASANRWNTPTAWSPQTSSSGRSVVKFGNGHRM